MSTPQLEDGYVQIANELLEAILAGGFSQRELLVLFAIIRKTYGFNKKVDDMSASQVGAMCQVARQHITTTFNALAARNVISKRRGQFGTLVGIQKDHRKWISSEQIRALSAAGDPIDSASPDLGLVPNQDTSRIGTGGSPESGQVDSPESGHTKDNLPKDNHQKTNSCAPVDGEQEIDEDDGAGAAVLAKPKRRAADQLHERFERFYAAYPKKRGRKEAEKVFGKLNPDDATVDAMLATIARFQASGEWSNPQFIPHPATWLNRGSWLDEIETAYTAEEVQVIDAFNAALGGQLGVVALTPFVANRAAAIRDFRTFSSKPGFVERFFPWVRDNAKFPPSVGFDWVISRLGYANLTSGQHSNSRKAA